MDCLRPLIFARTVSPKQRARFSAPPSASWKLPTILVVRYNIAVLKGDQEEMDRVVSQARESGGRNTGWLTRALALARSGRLQAARRSSSRAVDLALQEQFGRESAASYRASRALLEAVCGNAAEGVRSALAARTFQGPGRRIRRRLCPGSSGDSSRSAALAGDLEALPGRYVCEIHYAPVLRALAALRRAKPAESVERLEIARRYELAPNGLAFNGYYLGGLHSAYVRGEALIAAHRYAEAAAEFQKILDHRGIGAGSHRRTGALATRESVRFVGRQDQGESCL